MRFLLIVFFVASLNTSAQNFIVGSIHITGNKVTQNSIVLREIPVIIGQTIPADSLNTIIAQIQENLLNTSLFNYVTIDTSLTGKEIDLHIQLEERWYLWPYPILEHADRNLSAYLNNKEWDRINYGLYLVRYNFRGCKEIFKTKIRLGYKEQYALYYEKPYFNLSETFGFITDFSWFRQKEILYKVNNNKPLYFEGENYLRKEIRLFSSLLYRPKLYQKFKMSLGFNSIHIADTVSDLNTNYLDKRSIDRQLIASIEFTHDKRDSWVYPLKGYLIQSGVSALINEATQNYVYTHGNLQFFINPANRHFLQITSEAAWLSEKKPSFTKSLALGTDQYIRGFEYYLITGNYFYIVKSSYKYQVLQKKVFHITSIEAPKFNKIHLSSYLTLFFDYGYVGSDKISDNNTYSNNSLYSTGLGIDLVSYYDKVVRFEYTINNFGFKAFYIHIGAGI